MQRRLVALTCGMLMAMFSAHLRAQSDTESVYAPPAPPTPDSGTNQGALHLDTKVNYMTDYVYRGIQPIPTPNHGPNLQFDGELNLDLGKLPHPFGGIFTNINSSDPVNHFEEIRPFFGFDWKLSPFIFTAGDNSYIHPDRSSLDTSEVFWKLTFDDSIIWHTEKPLLSPYIYAAYDYDKYSGWYIEAGIKHDFEFRDLGFVLTAHADVAYVLDDSQFSNKSGDDTGFQHYEVGLIGTYSLNNLLNFSTRYGQWDLVGYLSYTGGIEDSLKAVDETWGGVGIGLRY